MREKIIAWLAKDSSHKGTTFERQGCLALGILILSSLVLLGLFLLLKPVVFHWFVGSWLLGTIFLSVRWGYKLGQLRGLQQIVDTVNGPFGEPLRHGLADLKKTLKETEERLKEE